MKIKILMLLIVFGIVFTVDIKAISADLSRIERSIPDVNYNISTAQNNRLDVNIMDLCAKTYSTCGGAGVAYYGNIVITNDTAMTVQINNLLPSGAVPVTKSIRGVTYDEATMRTILTDWYYMSFKSEAGVGLNVPDTTLASFDDATWTYLNYGNTAYQSVQGDIDITSSDIIIQPGTSITLYYDFTLSMQAGSQTTSLTSQVAVSLLFQKYYHITTEVVNGEIDQSLSKVAEGSNQLIKFKADDGYVLAKVIVDGEEIAIDENITCYEFTDIASDHTIRVEYKKQEASGNVKQNDEQQDNPVKKNNLPENKRNDAENKSNNIKNNENKTLIKAKLPFTGSSNDDLLGLALMLVGIFELWSYQKNSID